MKRKINCETARNFSVLKALEKLGHFPNRTTEKEAWFLSPFRSETQASFKVSKTKNRWFDHGEGVGGNVIDLVCRILKCTIKEALEFLNDGTAISPFKHQPIFNNKETKIDIVNVKDITHTALIQYLNFRGIPLMTARIYCKEVWYRYKDTRFFAIGLRNAKNGWELRNKLFKNSSSPKFYTYIQNNNKQLIMLEGMFDLLTLATLNESLLKASDILVLNSIAFIRSAEDYIERYVSVHLYLDNDKAGERATEYLTKKHKNVIDKRKNYKNYKNYKDLNDLICHEKGKQI